MAIVISGVNNNDKITAADGLIDILSGVSFASTITAPGFSATNNLTAASINVGSNIQIGNAGIITATTLIGNVTGNVNHTSNLLLQISGSEKLRIANSGAFGLNGTNYGSSGQVLTSQGSGSSPTWTTISSDLVSDSSPQLGGDLDTNSHHILLDDLHSLKLGDNADAEIRHDGYSAVEIKFSDATTTISTQSPPCGIRVTNTSNTTNRLNGIYFTHGSETANVGLFAKQKDNATSSAGEGSDLLIYTKQNGESIMEPRFRFTNAGHFEPENNTTHNIGSSTKKIANTYTGGLYTYGQYTHTGTHGSTILNSTGAEIVLTRGARNQIYANNSSGFIDFHTGGQTTYPAIRIFATPETVTGAKVGINTDTIGVDTQMSVMASPGKPGLYTSYGMRIMPNGTNSFGYSGQYITNASGIYVIHTTIPANNTWTQVCAGRYHGATVTCRVGDASSKRTIFANYDFTAPNYGVAHYNEIANNGNWNTGSASMRVANAGTYDYALEVQHNSYYNTSNTSSVALIFNIC